MRHPDELELALYSSSDLGLLRRWRVWAHLRQCPECRLELDRLRRAGRFLHEVSGEMPPGVHWARLSAEMHANVKLGLAAGAIAGPAGGFDGMPSRPMGLRVAAAVACMTVLVISGWFLQLPRPGSVARSRKPEAAVILKSTRSGIAMEENGWSLALMHRPSEQVTLTAGGQGELRARYVDEETGEVTIHHVYAE